jgi:hypothetical protein
VSQQVAKLIGGGMVVAKAGWDSVHGADGRPKVVRHRVDVRVHSQSDGRFTEQPLDVLVDAPVTSNVA